MDTATSVERQLYILSLLSQSQKGYTLKEIIDHLQRVGVEATRRMVARDMDSISANFFVYEEEQNGATVYKADKYALSGIDFTMPQIIALYYLKEILKTNQPGNIAGEAAGIIDKMLGQMPALSKTALGDVEKMIKVVPTSVPGEEHIDEMVLETVRAAAAEGRTVEVWYTPFSTGESTVRKFDPYLLEVREGCWHTIGHCHLRDSVRDLRISRITEVRPTNARFTIPDGFYDQYKRTRFDKMAGEDARDICVEFTGMAAKLVSEYNAEKADLLKWQGDVLLFRKRAALTPDLVQWLLSFGAEAKVTEPRELAQGIADEAKKITELYR